MNPVRLTTSIVTLKLIARDFPAIQLVVVAADDANRETSEYDRASIVTGLQLVGLCVGLFSVSRGHANGVFTVFI